jgi:transcriptional regulator with XRE-family HTH domain
MLDLLDPVSILGQMSAAAAERMTDLEALAARAEEVNRRQAASGAVIDGTQEFVDDLARRFGSMGGQAPADPQDELLFYRALTDLQLACRTQDRRAVRIGLQRVQDALMQIISNQPVREGRDAREIAAWVAETFRDVTRAKLADVLGVDRRTFNRWADGQTRPTDEDARRLRTFARTANLLLRGLTATGVVSWFELPNRELGGRAPQEDLSAHDSWVRLERAAYVTLAGDAS